MSEILGGNLCVCCAKVYLRDPVLLSNSCGILDLNSPVLFSKFLGC